MFGETYVKTYVSLEERWNFCCLTTTETKYCIRNSTWFDHPSRSQVARTVCDLTSQVLYFWVFLCQHIITKNPFCINANVVEIKSKQKAAQFTQEQTETQTFFKGDETAPPHLLVGTDEVFTAHFSLNNLFLSLLLSFPFPLFLTSSIWPLTPASVPLSHVPFYIL